MIDSSKFRSAAQLGFSEEHRSALIKTLELIEGGQVCHVTHDALHIASRTHDALHIASRNGRKIKYPFNMMHWMQKTSCGTVCCLGGTAAMLAGKASIWMQSEASYNPALSNLFIPKEESLHDITPKQAGKALRSYLETGHANWSKAMQ